jgi:hypothetical protein
MSDWEISSEILLIGKFYRLGDFVGNSVNNLIETKTMLGA